MKDKTEITSSGVDYQITPVLRYAQREVHLIGGVYKSERRLQQMWQGSDGSQKWEWVEDFDPITD